MRDPLQSHDGDPQGKRASHIEREKDFVELGRQGRGTSKRKGCTEETREEQRSIREGISMWKTERTKNVRLLTRKGNMNTNLGKMKIDTMRGEQREHNQIETVFKMKQWKET